MVLMGNEESSLLGFIVVEFTYQYSSSFHQHIVIQ